MNSISKVTVISCLIVSMSGCSSMDKQDGGSVAGTVAGGVNINYQKKLRAFS